MDLCYYYKFNYVLQKMYVEALTRLLQNMTLFAITLIEFLQI